MVGSYRYKIQLCLWLFHTHFIHYVIFLMQITERIVICIFWKQDLQQDNTWRWYRNTLSINWLRYLLLTFPKNRVRLVSCYPFVLHVLDTDPGGRAVQSVGLQPLPCWDCGFESSQGHRCLYLGCCIFRYRCLRWADHSFRRVLPNVVCLSVISKPQQWGGLSPLGLSSH